MKTSETYLFKDIKYFIAISLLFLSIISNAQTKKVFAHYMVCNKSYDNGSVAGYKQDIQDAQRVGVDGFALNIGGWDANYQQNTARLFQAASELGTNFMFFFSPDRCCGLSETQIVDMVSTYASHPNHFKYNNQPFLSSWGMTGGTAERDYWKQVVLTPLQNKGYNMYFVPYLFTTDFDETPDYNKFLSNYNTWWDNFLNGYFYFGAVGLPSYTAPSILTSGEAGAKVFHDHGLKFMSSLSPYYWGEKQTSAGRRYYEYHGGEGIAAQWKSILEIQKPEWIEFTTWNDWGEGTYMSPMDDINKYWPYAGHPQLGFYKTHRGFAELNKYYINWYKNGVQPTIVSDNIYFFYRTHPKNLVASNDPQGPVTWQTGDVNDEIHVTTMLTSPAELRVITGGVTKSYNVGAGIVHTRIPFNTGMQTFEIWRNGTRIIQKQGENILSTITEYDFNVFSDFASTAPVASSPAPLPPATTGTPDLVVTNISMSPVNPLPGQVVTFSATIKNQGTTATPDGTIVGVSFTVDNGTPIWSSNYTSIAAGASFVATVNGSASGIITWNATAGSHTIDAIADDVNRIAESNESNNKLSQAFTIQSQGSPDLVISSISMSPSNPSPGQAVTFSATIKNQGTAATPDGTIVGVSFSVDNVTSVWSSNSISIPAGGAFVATANGSASGVITWNATAGNHTIEAFADDVNRITESNESNNKLSQAFTIQTPIAPDLVVTNISMSPSNPLPGQAVTFSATVKNKGTSATPNGTIVGVSMTVDNVTSVWSSNYISIPAGASIVATANGSSSGVFTWNAVSGNHTIEALADDINRIAESDESNNKLSQTFTIQAPGNPDLIVTNISMSPANPLPGQSVTFSATIKNQGSGPTPAGTILGVLFTVDTIIYKWSDNLTSSLAAGASITATANGGAAGSATWNAVAGKHIVIANVDDVNRIPESIESNNTLNNTFIIQPPSTGTGLSGQYFDNMDFTNLKLTRTDANINFNWGSGSPASSMGIDQFSVRWTGQIQPLYSESYTFYTNSDDGVKLWVNGQLVINNWTDHGPTENNGIINLIGGQKYDIKMEYYENGGGAIAMLSWSSKSQAKQIIPKSQLYPAVTIARDGLLTGPELKNEISVYPNPSHGEINIDYNSLHKEPITIMIYDINGMLLLIKDLEASTGINQYVLDINKLIPGMYLLHIISHDERIIKKIIVN